MKATVKRMLRERRPGRRSLRQAARDLGVNHGHLSRVLRGERESRSLLARYEAWKGGAG
jgi:transcriptional regulator with XRE-family HTH domain